MQSNWAELGEVDLRVGLCYWTKLCYEDSLVWVEQWSNQLKKFDQIGKYPYYWTELLPSGQMSD